MPWPDQFDLLERDDQVLHVGRLICDLHDAIASFTPPPDSRWQVLIPADGNDLIIHHDLAPWNLVVGDPQWVSSSTGTWPRQGRDSGTWPTRPTVSSPHG